MKVEMQNGQHTTRRQTSLITSLGRGSEDGGRAEVSGCGGELGDWLLVIGFSVERISCQVNIWMNELLKSKVTSSPVTETQLGGDSPTLLM